MSNILLLVSRVLLAALFIVFGFIKFQNIAFFLNLREIKQVTELVGIGPSPLWFGYLVATIEVLGGIAILIGFKTRWVAWGLVVYLIIATLVGHPFWAMEGPVRFSYQFHFYKNLAIIAAYLMLIVSGPGAYSVDAKIGEKV